MGDGSGAPSYICPTDSRKFTFTIWIGVNDVDNSYSGPGEDALINKDLDKYFSVLESLTPVEHETLLFSASLVSLSV
jgi:hypothetical protein